MDTSILTLEGARFHTFPYAIWGTKFPFLYELACHPRSTCIPPAMHCPISSIAQF